jgi:hypothetical protein
MDHKINAPHLLHTSTEVRSATPEELERRRAWAERAQRNRELMPETAAEVAGWRRVFGDGTRLLWAEEGELELKRGALEPTRKGG